jgi:hypothetical protein
VASRGGKPRSSAESFLDEAASAVENALGTPSAHDLAVGQLSALTGIGYAVLELQDYLADLTDAVTECRDHLAALADVAEYSVPPRGHRRWPHRAWRWGSIWVWLTAWDIADAGEAVRDWLRDARRRFAYWRTTWDLAGVAEAVRDWPAAVADGDAWPGAWLARCLAWAGGRKEDAASPGAAGCTGCLVARGYARAGNAPDAVADLVRCPEHGAYTHQGVLTAGVAEGWADAETDPARIDWPARQAGRRACAAHTATYTLTLAGCLALAAWRLSVPLSVSHVAAGLAVSAVTHYAADRRRPLECLAALMGGKICYYRAGSGLATGAACLDQAFHWACLFVSALVIAGGWAA